VRLAAGARREKSLIDAGTIAWITALSRSGALDQARRVFEEAGLESAVDQPAVLSLQGRLIKDEAATARETERRRLYREAAAAYGAAGDISGSTYPLINAATLALLAGDAEQARARATRLLTRIDAAGDDPDETPYYARATRAEALLLVGEIAAAGTAMTEAVALAPRAWEDHASTLRQFGLILAELGEDAAWLEPLRPPRALHFGGGMGLAGDGGVIAAWLAEARVGFGYGALAAGGDILVAEALVEAGAQLHVVLPCPPEAFRRASVEPYGGDWPGRFDRLLGLAETLHVAGSGCPGGDDPVAPDCLQLAAEVAMGRAVMQAGLLATGAVQLLVAGPTAGPTAGTEGAVGGTAWMGQAWRAAGRPGEILTLPPGAAAAALRRAAASPCTLVAMLMVESTAGPLDAAAIAGLAAATGTGVSGRWTSGGLILRCKTPAEAAATALAVTAALGEAVRIGAAYDLAEAVADPFGGPPLLLGAAIDLAARAAASAPSGAVHATADFAAALQAGPAAGRPRVELVGDMTDTGLEDPVQLYAVKPPTG
jgi:tetratricopeptide (TPR) repeat protein